METDITPFPGQAGGWSDGGGNSFQVVVDWVNSNTGEIVQAPNSSWRPPTDAGWEVSTGQAINPSASTSQAATQQQSKVEAQQQVIDFQSDQYKLIQEKAQSVSYGITKQQSIELEAMKTRRIELSKASMTGRSVTDLWREILEEK